MLTQWLPLRTIHLGILGISSSLFKCIYLKNGKRLLNFLFHLSNLHQILNMFEKKMIVEANVFPKLQIVKDLAKRLSRKRRFRTCFSSHRVNGGQTLLKPAWEHLYHIFWSLWMEMTWKISPLQKFEILGVFVNTLTADDKYSVLDWENLKFSIQMQIS